MEKLQYTSILAEVVPFSLETASEEYGSQWPGVGLPDDEWE